MERRIFLKNILLGSGSLFLAPTMLKSITAYSKNNHFNVLMIIVDDLRPQLGCYGHPYMVTPNIDRLAEEGTLFVRSYCNAQVCGPSRASVFSGLRPTRQRFVNNDVRLDKECPQINTLHGHFHNNGYYTLSNGKVLHTIYDSNNDWSEPAWSPDWEKHGTSYIELDFMNYQKEDNKVLAHNNDKRYVGPAFECADVPDNAYFDGQIAEMAVHNLSRLKDLSQPFFLAVGFKKPHLPFTSPKKYWDLYQKENINLPDNYFRPKNAPTAAFHNWRELRGYANIQKQGHLTEDQAKTLIHAYYAATSFSDANVGKLLNALDDFGLRENTIVLLWGDHGWHLGEHAMWTKRTQFEISTRAPLIVSVPGLQGGQKTDSITELIDIYPSLCELCDIPIPTHLEGTSFKDILKNPEQSGDGTAYSHIGDGDSIRLDRYRYAEYTNDEGEIYGRMLYDHYKDPSEDIDISKKPENSRIAKKLSKMLKNKKINLP